MSSYLFYFSSPEFIKICDILQKYGVKPFLIVLLLGSLVVILNQYKSRIREYVGIIAKKELEISELKKDRKEWQEKYLASQKEMFTMLMEKNKTEGNLRIKKKQKKTSSVN